MKNNGNLPSKITASSQSINTGANAGYTITSAGTGNTLTGVQGITWPSTQTFQYPPTMPSIPNLLDWAIGFEHQWSILEDVRSTITKTTYPPYNIIKINSDEYKIEIAVAGFKKKDLEITKQELILTVKGTRPESKEEPTYTHKGIGGRDFKHTFVLAEYVDVVSAGMEDGILTISLRRELPEEKKPRTIAIK